MSYTRGEKNMKTATSFNIKETLKDIEELKCLAVPSRGLTEEDAKLYGIKSSVSETDGKTITASYYPYYNIS